MSQKSGLTEELATEERPHAETMRGKATGESMGFLREARWEKARSLFGENNACGPT